MTFGKIIDIAFKISAIFLAVVVAIFIVAAFTTNSSAPTTSPTTGLGAPESLAGVSQTADAQTDAELSADEASAEASIAAAMSKWHYQIFTDDATGRPRYMAAVSQTAGAQDEGSLSLVDDPAKGLMAYFALNGKQYNCSNPCYLNVLTKQGPAIFTMQTVPEHPDIMEIMDAPSLEAIARQGGWLRILIGGYEYDFDLDSYNDDKFHPTDWRAAMEQEKTLGPLGRQ